jgi:hydrogenase small subunit
MAFAPINAVTELDILWITAGLGCDGDTIAMTAATQPSIEDVLRGQVPWIPQVNLHNPFLAMANGDDFLNPSIKQRKERWKISFW